MGTRKTDASVLGYLFGLASYFARGNEGITPRDAEAQGGRRYYNFDGGLKDSTGIYNPVEGSSAYDLYLDPQGDRLLVTGVNAWQGSSVAGAAEGLVSKLYALLGTWPKGFDAYKDEQFVAGPDGSTQPILESPYSGMRWDPRRLFATLAVGDFKTGLRDLLTGANDTALDDGHRYSRQEMRSFWDAIAGQCDAKMTLYEAATCREANGEELIGKFRRFAELLAACHREPASVSLRGADAPKQSHGLPLPIPPPSRGRDGERGIASSPSAPRNDTLNLTPKQVIDIAHEAGLTKQELHFFALVARNQHRPEGLSAQDYPAYLECRDVDFDRMLSGSGNDAQLASRAEACLRSAARIVAEPNALDRGGDRHRTHPAPLMDGLAAVRQRALVLSTFSRACQTNLDFTSILRFDPLAARDDDETNKRCLTADVEALKSMRDPFAELDRGLLRESAETRALQKAIKSAIPEPEPRTPNVPREFFNITDPKLLVAMANIPGIGEEEDPEAKKDGATGKPDGKVPEKGAKGAPTKQQISEAVKRAIEKAAANPNYDAKQKAAIEKLAKDEKRIAKLEAHYEQQTKDHKGDTDKAIARVEKNLEAAIVQAVKHPEDVDKKTAEKIASADDAAKSEEKVEGEQKAADKAAADDPSANNAADVKSKNEAAALEQEFIRQLQEDAKAAAPELSPITVPVVENGHAPAKLRSRAELAIDARTEMESLNRAIKEGRPYRINLDMGRFFAESEINDAGDAKVREQLGKYANDLARIKAIARSVAANTQGATEEKALAIVRALNQDYLSLYSRDNALLTDFFSGKGGNCEAQTKFILTALLATDLKNDPSSIMAVQVYKDHMQLVLYDGISGIVTNLLTGDKVAGVEAPLYHPNIMLNAYLRGKGEASPVSDEQLKIADVPAVAQKGGAMPGRNTGNTAMTAEQIDINDMIARERMRVAVERDIKSRAKEISAKLPKGVTLLDVIRITMRAAGSLKPEDLRRASRFQIPDLSNQQVPREVIEEVIKRLPTLVGMAGESEIAVGSNTRLVMPGSTSRFANGPIPRHAMVAPPRRASQMTPPNFTGRRGLPNTHEGLGGASAPDTPVRSINASKASLVSTYDEYRKNPAMLNNANPYNQTKKHMESRLISYVFYKDETVRHFFKYKSDAMEFSRLEAQALSEKKRFGRVRKETNQAFEKFDEDIWYRGVNELLHRGEYDQLANLFTTGLMETHKLNKDKVNKLMDYMEYINDGIFNDAPKSLHDVVEYGNGSYSATSNPGKVINAHPRLKRLVSLHQAFVNRLRQNPEILVQYFDRHPEAYGAADSLFDRLRFSLRQSMNFNPTTEGTRFDSLRATLATAFLDPDRVTYFPERQGRRAREGEEARIPHVESGASVPQNRRPRTIARSSDSLQKARQVVEPLAPDSNNVPAARDEGMIPSSANRIPLPGRPAIAPDVDVAAQEEITAVLRSTGKKDPLKLTPNPRARVKIKPENYIIELLRAFEAFKDDPARLKQLSRLWTRDMSKLALASVVTDKSTMRTQNYYDVFVLRRYREISNERPAQELTYPGPDGRGVPEDIAMLIHDKLTDNILFFEEAADPGFLGRPGGINGARRRARAYLDTLSRALNGKTKIE
ncbi:MAG: hypothetical protein WC690_05525 [bacterium]